MYSNELDRFHNRKSPRLKHYDYAQPNLYFVTICTHQKQCIFGDPANLSAFGLIAKQALGSIQIHFPDTLIQKYIVMPNHVHAIIQIKKAGTDLSVVIGQYKSFVTRQIRKSHPQLMVWQASFHDHVIRGEQDYLRIWQYIDSNPAQWQEDCFYPNSAG